MGNKRSAQIVSKIQTNTELCMTVRFSNTCRTFVAILPHFVLIPIALCNNNCRNNLK